MSTKTASMPSPSLSRIKQPIKHVIIPKAVPDFILVSIMFPPKLTALELIQGNVLSFA